MAEAGKSGREGAAGRLGAGPEMRWAGLPAVVASDWLRRRAAAARHPRRLSPRQKQSPADPHGLEITCQIFPQLLAQEPAGAFESIGGSLG